MAYRMDRMIGPEGEWRSEDAEAKVAPDRLKECRPSGREEFIRRCLNAAVNLYGILTYPEFIDLYNGYARERPRPVSDTLTKDELEDFVVRHLDDIEAEGSGFGDDFLNESDFWFANWYSEKAGEDLLVQFNLTTSDMDGTPRYSGNVDKEIDRHIAKVRSRFLDVPKKILSEREFLEYEEPIYSEATAEADEVAKFLSEEYGIGSDDAEMDVGGIQGHLRFNGATQTLILEYIRDNCDYEPEDWHAMERLIRATGPLVGVTRTWYFRGHTGSELAKLGLLPRVEREDIYDVFGLDDDDDSLECNEDDFGDDDRGEFLNARFAWLEILAVKSSVGYKCRDLLTGEELFLMSKSVAAGDVRGAVIFTPISPIGDVYLSLGVVQPVLFPEPLAVLKSVLDDLKIPDERPIRLSPDDHVRFVTETIRRINEHGDLGSTIIKKC